ncbi:MAG: hypothetical protein JWM59_3793 [Verrucomicrobiales bacterium]|nr:hypothetical protein [Verrucomicrobiales bacterium]
MFLPAFPESAASGNARLEGWIGMVWNPRCKGLSTQGFLPPPPLRKPAVSDSLKALFDLSPADLRFLITHVPKGEALG